MKNERVKELRLSKTEVVVTAPSQQADAFFSGCLTYSHSVLVSSSEPSSVSHKTSRSRSLRRLLSNKSLCCIELGGAVVCHLDVLCGTELGSELLTSTL